MTSRQKQTAPSGTLGAAGTTRPAGPCYLCSILPQGDLPVNPDPDPIEQATQRVRAAAQAARDDFWRAWDAGEFAGAEHVAAQIATLVGPRDKGVDDGN